MNELFKNWKSRTLIISAIVIITCLLIYLLDATEWAENMRENSFGHRGGGEGRPRRPDGGALTEIFKFFGAFLKEILLIGVPMAIAIGVGAFYKSFIKKTKPS